MTTRILDHRLRVGMDWLLGLVPPRGVVQMDVRGWGTGPGPGGVGDDGAGAWPIRIAVWLARRPA